MNMTSIWHLPCRNLLWMMCLQKLKFKTTESMSIILIQSQIFINCFLLKFSLKNIINYINVQIQISNIKNNKQIQVILVIKNNKKQAKRQEVDFHLKINLKIKIFLILIHSNNKNNKKIIQLILQTSVNNVWI